jgi:hypothetical protein
MSNRTWFYASEGQQKGPFPEAQLLDLIARGTVRADSLVWTEGMSGWQKAAEIPGLVPGAAAPPPMPGGPPQIAVSGSYSGGPLSADLPVFPMFGRAVLMIIGGYLVIPAPWTYTAFYRWFISRVRVPGRPNLGFSGQPLDIWYVFVGLGLLGLLGLAPYAGFDPGSIARLITMVAVAFGAWMIICWLASHLTSDGQPLPISFKGSPLIYVGWYIGLLVSAITIIGWAWVMTAWMRWICANFEGTRREVIFTASGLEVLWRTIVFTIGCGFLIPIPWVLAWYTRWFVSQFALVERGAAV